MRSLFATIFLFKIMVIKDILQSAIPLTFGGFATILGILVIVNPGLSDSKSSGITNLASVLVAGASGMTVPMGKNRKDEETF